jgi:hypothetical protein
MTLPLDPSNPPMEAHPVGNLPEGEQWRYEVRYHQATEGRLRHGATLRRRRFDKAP